MVDVPMGLDDAEVRTRLRAPDAVAVMRGALVAFHRGQFVAPPRVSAVFTFMAGRLVGRCYGFRSYATHVAGEQSPARPATPRTPARKVAPSSSAR